MKRGVRFVQGVVNHMAVGIGHRDVGDETAWQGLDDPLRNLVEPARVAQPLAAQIAQLQVERGDQATDLPAHGVGQEDAALLGLQQHLLLQQGLGTLRLPPQERRRQHREQRHQGSGMRRARLLTQRARTLNRSTRRGER